MIDFNSMIDELNNHIYFENSKMLTEGEVVIWLKALRDENKQLQSENTRLKAERDKAVEDLKTINHQDMNGIINMCEFCKHGFDKTCAKCCIDNWTNNFEWRGLG